MILCELLSSSHASLPSSPRRPERYCTPRKALQRTAGSLECLRTRLVEAVPLPSASSTWMSPICQMVGRGSKSIRLRFHGAQRHGPTHRRAASRSGRLGRGRESGRSSGLGSESGRDSVVGKLRSRATAEEDSEMRPQGPQADHIRTGHRGAAMAIDAVARRSRCITMPSKWSGNHRLASPCPRTQFSAGGGGP